MIDLLGALTPEHIHVGYDPDTGVAVHVPRAHFERGVNLVGAVGSGKTDFVVEFLRAMAFSAAPWCYLDFAGSGFAAAARFDALAATLLGLGVEALYADTVPEAVGIAGRFMRRHAYVTIGEDDPPVRLNILRRLRRRDGRRETPQRVAGRFADVWSTQFAKDADIRVRFAKWCTVGGGPALRRRPPDHRIPPALRGCGVPRLPAPRAGGREDGGGSLRPRAVADPRQPVATVEVWLTVTDPVARRPERRLRQLAAVLTSAGAAPITRVALAGRAHADPAGAWRNAAACV